MCGRGDRRRNRQRGRVTYKKSIGGKQVVGDRNESVFLKLRGLFIKRLNLSFFNLQYTREMNQDQDFSAVLYNIIEEAPFLSTQCLVSLL